jgi:hypothetical protein
MEAAIDNNLPDGPRPGEVAHCQNIPAITPLESSDPHKHPEL